MEKQIILMSHGMMAQEVLHSAKMIVGDQINYPVVCMTPDDGIDGTMTKLNQILSELPEDKEVIVIADLLGGTPANVASMKAAERPHLKVVTGMNLGMVLESFFLLDSDHLAEQLVNIGSQGVSIVGTKVIDSEDE